MNVIPTPLAGAFLAEIQPHADRRGFFARAFCEREFLAAGISVRMVQTNISWNAQRGTLRGLHFQWPPSGEGKLVRCTRGHVLDVLLDLRPTQPTFGRHVSVELDAQSRRAVYIPPGIAHGFQTLQDDTEILYQMSDYYAPELADGVRWNDPAFAISWPIAPAILSDRDAQYPDFDAAAYRQRYLQAARTRTDHAAESAS